MAENAEKYPNLKPIKKGEVRNPKGITRAGDRVRTAANTLAAKKADRAKLLKLVRDPSTPYHICTAALQLLRGMQLPDLADFEPLVNGSVGLEELRKTGVDTSVIKKIKVRTTTDASGSTTIEREVELHDHAGQSFDRVVEQTAGKPVQPIEQNTALTVDATPASNPVRDMIDRLRIKPDASDPLDAG